MLVTRNAYHDRLIEWHVNIVLHTTCCYLPFELAYLSLASMSTPRPMGLLPDTLNCGFAHAPGMPGTFPRPRFQRKPLVSDPGMHHGTCVTHVPWSMSGSLTSGGGENVPGILGACATRNFTYLARGPWWRNTHDDICVDKPLVWRIVDAKAQEGNRFRISLLWAQICTQQTIVWYN